MPHNPNGLMARREAIETLNAMIEQEGREGRR